MTLHRAVVACWHAAGCPEPNWQGKARTPRPVPEPRDGVCALTGEAGSVFDAGAVVSSSFVDWDRLPFRDVDRRGVAFSPAAAWAFRNRDAMYRPHAVIDGVHREVTPDELARLLSAPDRTQLISVPLARLGVHVLPFVAAGHVSIDGTSLAWRAADGERLRVYRELHGLGFSATALRQPVPLWPVLRGLDGDLKHQVLEMWPLLDEWRAHGAYLDVAAVTVRAAAKAPIPTSGRR